MLIVLILSKIDIDMTMIEESKFIYSLQRAGDAEIPAAKGILKFPLEF
jgi:hypothetical protein